MFVSAFAGFC
uniref:Uncharacterized protein n=1 Tax=Arundo donax TaxID=35708 RepID=A0A0A9FFA4_ARUDO